MVEERRSETPTSDKAVRSGIYFGDIIQSLILAGIISTVTVLVGIREQVSVVVVQVIAMQGSLQDHESRIRSMENRKNPQELP